VNYEILLAEWMRGLHRPSERSVLKIERFLLQKKERKHLLL